MPATRSSYAQSVTTRPTVNKNQRFHATERRQTERLTYSSYGTLLTPNHKCPIYLLDISEQGALVATLEENHHLEQAQEAVLCLRLDDGRSLKLRGHIAHSHDHRAGLQCCPSSFDDECSLHNMLIQLKEQQQAMRV